MPEHKGWYSRGYLPHFDRPDLIQAVTFRLHDSLPESVLTKWEDELRILPANAQKIERQKRLASYLDAGHGSCWLRDSRVAELAENALLHFDGKRYRLLAWVVMPNHVHLLVETRPEWLLPGVVQSWKTWIARRANEILGRNGSFWFREFHDRYIRDADHFENAKFYIENNPVKARLCGSPEKWRWGSAWEGRHVGQSSEPSANLE
jgi:REP element-mobilizing transposase RayT